MMILSAAVYLPMSHHKPGLQQNIANTGDSVSVPNINGCAGAIAPNASNVVKMILPYSTTIKK